jgi:hypothetical protein
MSFLGGCFAGLVIGIYFGEKDLPFPVKYNARQNGSLGSLELDLQVANTLANDIRGAFGYGPIGLKAAPTSPPV